MWDHLFVSRLTSSGLAQGCEEDQGAEDEEDARERGAFMLQLCIAEDCGIVNLSERASILVKSCERDLWFSLQSCRSSIAPGQQGEEGGWREERGGHEEGGQGDLRAEDAVAGPGGDLRQEGDAAH